MALAETARLVASLELKDHFTPSANKAIASLGRLESRATRVGQQIGKGFNNAAHNLRNVGIVAAAGIAVAVRGGIQSLAELEDATTSVDGAISQMGKSGKVTSAQIATWANDIESDVQAAFDDKAIVSATATLIRFGKVTTANIRPAMEVITDLAVRTGSVESAASQLGKALSNPTKAAGKLARNGIILTKAQEKQIAAFVKAGKVGAAQAVILDAVSKSTKGAAAASAGPYRDALNTMTDVTEDAQKALGIGFLPVIQKVAGLLKGELAKPSTLANLKAFGTTLAMGLDSLIDIARNLPWGVIGDSLKIAGAGAKSILTAFTSLPPWVQTAVLTGWGLNKLAGGALGGIVKELASGLIKGVLGMNAAVVNINAGVVNGPGGVPGVGGKGIPPVVTGVGGAAAAAGGISALAVGTLILAPAAVAVLGLAITKATDPQGVRQLQGKADTARGRGIPDWNNKALQELRVIARNTDTSTTRTETTKGNIFGPNGLGQSITDAQKAAGEKVTTSVEALKGKMATDLAANTESITTAANATTSAAQTAGTTAASAARSAGYGVEAAVRGSRPIVTTDVRVYVTAAGVTKSTTEQTRYGPGNGSAGGGDRGGAFGGH